MSPAKRIVVLGGGFAGLHLVRRLEGRLHREEASVTLVDRQNYHLFTPLLYQVCTGELPPHAVAYPLRDATAPARFQFMQSEVTAIDLEHRRVGTADGELPFDHLVIVLGSVTNDYGIPGVRENALPVKWLSDAEAPGIPSTTRTLPLPLSSLAIQSPIILPPTTKFADEFMEYGLVR